MHIGIDARMYGPQHGGIGRYIEQLIAHLIQNNHETTYTFFVHPNNPLPHIPSQHTLISTTIPWYSLKEQTHLPRIINETSCDLIHFPHWNVPRLLKKPFVTTIHDLILIHHPDRRASKLSPITYAIKYKAFTYILAHAAKNARHILTVSDFSKQDIIQTLKINPQSITTTHLGYTPCTPHDAVTLHENPYMLAVGVHYPHKNHQLLLDIFPRITGNMSNYDLIIAGPHGPFTNELQNHITDTNEQCTHKRGRVILKTAVSDDAMSALYKHADMLLFPSLYEGFGLPPLEAMAHGTPVIASNTSAIPETCGTSALLISPIKQDEWINAIHTIHNDTRLRETLISRGYIRCQGFSWTSCAQSTHNVYKKWSQ